MLQKLTIILPINQRPNFTLRFLDHAESQKLNCQILIADGEKNKRIQKILNNSKKRYPSLKIIHLKFRKDKTYKDFYVKMVKTLNQVSTKYVKIADNDDFLIQSGILHSINILEAKPSYVCAAAGLSGMQVEPKKNNSNNLCYGEAKMISYRFTPLDKSEDFCSSDATERVAKGARNWWSYYGIYRTPTLKKIWKDICKINFSDLLLFEIYHTIATLLHGKIISDPKKIFYVRQYNTSQQSSFKSTWGNHLLKSNFSSDVKKLKYEIIKMTKNSKEKNKLSKTLDSILEKWLDDFLLSQYGQMREFKRFCYKYAYFLVKLKYKSLMPYFASKIIFLFHLFFDSKSFKTIFEFNKELKIIEKVLLKKNY